MSAPKKTSDTASVRDASLRKRLGSLGDILDNGPGDAVAKATGVFRKPPANDNQPDFFVPTIQDVPIKDGLDLMDIAVFRLAKSQTRKGDIIRHELPGVTITVAGGAHGMATIMDYDIVLMMVSHLAEQTRLYRHGRAPKPCKAFRPSSVEIFKFCRVSRGGCSYDMLAEALRRLQGTFIEIAQNTGAKKSRRTGYFPLIAGADVISKTDTGRIGTVEIIIPDWMYDAVTMHTNPEVLTVDPDYFLLKKGLARFVYRLARKAAGKNEATYSFASVHTRSGSTRPLNKFTHDLRALIADNALPGYELHEVSGIEGPQLCMRCRPQILTG